MWLLALYRNAEQMGIYFREEHVQMCISCQTYLYGGHAILVGFLSLPEWYNECMPLQDALVTMYRVGVVRGTRTAARILISNLEFTIHCSV